MTTLLQTDCSSLVQHELVLDNPALSVDELIQECAQTVDGALDVRPEIIMFGKTCHQNRCVGFFSNASAGYNYSTTITASKEMPPCLEYLLNQVNKMFGCDYNGVLINKYVDGCDSIGRHSDDIRGIDPKVGVVCISYGAERIFRIRCKHTGKIVFDLPMVSGQLIQMAGDFQNEFTHEVPVQKRVFGTRYSFTFRKHTV